MEDLKVTSNQDRVNPVLARRETEPFSKSVAIVTTTFYPKWYPGEDLGDRNIDKVRGDLALQMVREARNRNIRVVVIDEANNRCFKDRVSEYDINLFPETDKGMSGSRQQGFREASLLNGVKVICWVEPEKVSVARDCLQPLVAEILEGRADVVVPKRNEQLFRATYPDYQVEFEQKSNHLWNGILRKYGLRSSDDPDLDVWFGPKVFKNDPEIVKLFLDRYSFNADPDLSLHKIMKPELWPNAIFFPVIAALAKGYRVTSVEVPYRHPEEQTRQEQETVAFRRKREIQQRSIVLLSELFTRKLLNISDGDQNRLKKVETK